MNRLHIAAVLGALGSVFALAPFGCGGEEEATTESSAASGGATAGQGGASITSTAVVGGGGPTSAGTGGSEPDAGPDAACASGTQACGALCVGLGDPAFGCGDPSCVPCPAANATAACFAGACDIGTCDVGFSNCDQIAANGCEVSTETNPAHCGGCGDACSVPHATAGCAASACTITLCDAGFSDCNGDATDGCEVNLQADPANCSGCGFVCAPAGSVCNGGVCASSPCASGLGDCDLSLANGCETNLLTSVQHCGFCNNACTLWNATSACAGGVCTIGSCNAGHANCDNIAANGCETNTSSSASNCGGCGNVCASGVCVAGVCQTACGNGFIEGSEQCDDANLVNLDGCDSTCRYEVVHRMTVLEIRREAAPSWCTPTTNQFGAALTQLAADSFNSTLTSDVDNGILNVLTQALGLDDPTGMSDPLLEVGVMDAALDPAKGVWMPPGAIDWWFLANAAGLDAAGKPTNRLTPGAFSSGVATAGPSTISLFLLNAQLTMQSARVRAAASGTTSVPAPPPAALAAGLTVFEGLTADQANQGLCGNITVGSLALVPAPQSVTTSGGLFTQCQSSCTASRSYTYCGMGQPVGPACNSLLDVLVGGCRAAFCVNAITPKQPDVGTGSNPPAPLVNDPANDGKVTVTQPNDAYSSYFRFVSQRAHATNNLP